MRELARETAQILDGRRRAEPPPHSWLPLIPSPGSTPSASGKLIMDVVARDGKMVSIGPAHHGCIIMPWFRALVVWDVLSIVFLAYTATYLPFRLAFVRAESTSVWDFADPLGNFEFVIDVFFLVDILRNFRTAYVNERGEVIADAWSIALNYLRTWFVLDLVASFPIEWFIGSPPPNDASLHTVSYTHLTLPTICSV